MAIRREKVMERLLELRERQGLSQEDAAHKVGITHRQWQRWENGESMPYPRNLDAVASKFGISIAEFFDPAENVDVDVAQLDRIEAKLDDILSRLPTAEEALLATLGEEADRTDAPAKRPAAKSSRSGRSRRAS